MILEIMMAHFVSKKRGVKVTFKTLLCPYYHRKIVQVDFTDENRILYMINDRTEVLLSKLLKEMNM